MTTIKKVQREAELVSVFNIAVHELAQGFTVQHGCVIGTDVLHPTCHLVGVAFNPPDVCEIRRRVYE